MYVTLVKIHVKSEHLAGSSRSPAPTTRGSVREPGNLRFERSPIGRGSQRFILYEPIATRLRRRRTRDGPLRRLARRGDRLDGRAASRVRYDGLFPAAPETSR